MAKLIPNAFQCPNDIIDVVWTFLTSQERDVLIFAIREILGWQDKIAAREANIAVSVFVDGKVTADGRRLSYGCGLGRSSLRKALDGLEKARLLIPRGKPTQAGQLYWLQDDTDNLDWDWLRARRAATDQANAKRVQAARKARAKRSVAQNTKPSVAQNTGVLSHRTEGVLSDRTKESHIQNQPQSQRRGANAPRNPQGQQPVLFQDDPEQTTAFSSDIDLMLKAMLKEQAQANPRQRAPRAFETFAQKEKWRKAAGIIVASKGQGELEKAIRYAFEQGRSSRASVINTVAVWAENIANPTPFAGKRCRGAPGVMSHTEYQDAVLERAGAHQGQPESTSYGTKELPF